MASDEAEVKFILSVTWAWLHGNRMLLFGPGQGCDLCRNISHVSLIASYTAGRCCSAV